MLPIIRHRLPEFYWIFWQLKLAFTGAFNLLEELESMVSFGETYPKTKKKSLNTPINCACKCGRVVLYIDTLFRKLNFGMAKFGSCT